MKKALLSLAVIAASGAYVVYENHQTQQPAQSTAEAVSTIAPAPVAPADNAVAVAPVASAGPTPSAFVITTSPEPATAVASPTPAIIPPDDSPVSNTAGSVAAIPMPKPRPATAPVTIIPAAAQKTAQATNGLGDGTFRGISANAYYGRLEVDAVIQGGRLVKVDILDYPSDRRTSRSINARALPELQSEAIQAQSANVDAVSGATLSSEAFMQSLDSALQQAHSGGNA